METIVPVIYSAAGMTVGILQGAIHAASVFLGKSQAAQAAQPGTSPKASPGKKRRTSDLADEDEGNCNNDNKQTAAEPTGDMHMSGEVPDTKEAVTYPDANAEVFKPTDQENEEPNETPVAVEAPTPAEAFGEATHDAPAAVSEKVTTLGDVTTVLQPTEHESYAAAVVETVEPDLATANADVDVDADARRTPADGSVEESHSGKENTSSGAKSRKARNGSKKRKDK